MDIPNIEEYKLKRFKRESRVMVGQSKEKRLFLENFEQLVSSALHAGHRMISVDMGDWSVSDSTVRSVLKKVSGDLKKKNYAVRIEDMYRGMLLNIYIEPKEKMRWWHWFLGWRWL